MMVDTTTAIATRYREEVLTGWFDPLAVVAALVGAWQGKCEHVVYERDGYWHLAAEPLGTVTVDARAVRDDFGGVEVAQPWWGTPWPAVRVALERAPVAGWRAYGWLTFELAGAPHRLDELARLVVPGVEVRVGEHDVLIRATRPEAVPALRDLVLTASPVPTPRTVAVDVRRRDDHYLEAVAVAVDRIRRGLLQKVILSRLVEVPFPVDLLATYVAGRRANTPARSFLLDLGGWQAAGFSPETVVEVSSLGEVSTQPLAGTRARTGEPGADGRLRADLTNDPKEVFEHATSVKLAFEELDTVGRAGATRVSEFLAVKERGSVQHLASRVNTVLDEERTGWDALGAVFPAITASGIPKAPAYELIAELEREPRGLYAGAVLRVEQDGDLDAALVLRTVYQRAGRTWLRAGAGLVAASQPAREHEETCEKLSSVAPYLVPASPTTAAGAEVAGEG